MNRKNEENLSKKEYKKIKKNNICVKRMNHEKERIKNKENRKEW